MMTRMQEIINVDLQTPESQIWVATIIITLIFGMTADLVNKTGALDRIIADLNEAGYYLIRSSITREMSWCNSENGQLLQGDPLTISFFDGLKNYETARAAVADLKTWYYPLHDQLGGTPNLYVTHCQLPANMIRQWAQSEYWITISDAWYANLYELAGMAINIT